jgi:hypothetical protein
MLQVEAILHHLLSTVGRMFRRIAIGFGSALVLTVGAVEGIALALTKDLQPSALTHVVALILGFSIAFNVALAIAIVEGIHSFIILISDVGKATEEAAKKVGTVIASEGAVLAHEAEHIVQNVEHGAVTAARDIAHIPGQIIGGVEGGVQGIERRIAGSGDTTSR